MHAASGVATHTQNYSVHKSEGQFADYCQQMKTVDVYNF